MAESIDDKDIVEILHSIALNAPKSSGVYIWKNKNETIIYVGKAKLLKNRLLSYFSSHKDIKTRLLISQATSLEYIQTQNEYEALLLENTLIKKHQPKYNISLKDGKTYPMLKLTCEPYPRIYRTRTICNDGAKYFGPFPNINNIDIFLEMVKKNYKLHQCKRIQKKTAPCLYYHINECSAPCCKKISEEEYNKAIKEIISILEGHSGKIIKELTKKMKNAVAIEDFETATICRNNIEAINALKEKNIVQDLDPTARDYIAWANAAQMISFAVLRMRGGHLVARDLYRGQTLKSDSEALLEFFMSYYTEAKNVPPKIFLLSNNESDLAQKWFVEKLNAQVELYTSSLPPEEVSYSIGNAKTINSPSINKKDANVASDSTYSYDIIKKGQSLMDEKFSKKDRAHHYAALEMARFNAKEDIIARLRSLGDYPALEELQNILKIPTIPYVIEGFDIAHLQGNFTVAGMVVFREGKPDKKSYRIFRLKNTDNIIDDYESMREAVARRYTRLINKKLDIPDLILIDGGAGQVNAAWKILCALELDISLIGLAERNEEIYFPNNSKPFVLPRRSYALRLLQRVRDEVHRFCNTHVSKTNIKKKTTSIFESLPHVGKKRAVKLIKSFGDIATLRNADIEKIAKTIGISASFAKEIKECASKLK